MELYDRFVRCLDLYLKQSLQLSGAHLGFIGNIYYSHDICAKSLDNLKPDSGFLHKRQRLVSISKRFSYPFRVLEIGVNAGHSASLFLLSNELSEYVGIDNAQSYNDGNWLLRSDIYVPEALRYLQAAFPDRVSYMFGNSYDVISEYALNVLNHKSIDILHLDAQKEYYYQDFLAALPLLKPNSYVIIDDTTSPDDTAHKTTLKLISNGYLKIVSFPRNFVFQVNG